MTYQALTFESNISIRHRIGRFGTGYRSMKAS